MADKSHIGMKLIGILGIIGGIIALIAGLYFYQAGNTIMEAQKNLISIIPLVTVGASMWAIAIALVIVGLIAIFLGIFIYKERRWAYVLLWVISIIAFASSLFVFNIWGLVIPIIIMAYLFYIRHDFFGSGKSKVEYREA